MSERMSDERLSDDDIDQLGRSDLRLWGRLPVKAIVAEIDALRAELTATHERENETAGRVEAAILRLTAELAKAERERDSARADALEEAAKVCDAEVDTRTAFMARADAGSLEWGPDPKRSGNIQGHKAVTAIGLAKAIRALKPTPTPDR